ncbi:MAG TPA: asparaginase [Candidatus Limnocylindria bacterium]|nr:asparaginase [Candidatus Limnocylindria bacterium]
MTRASRVASPPVLVEVLRGGRVESRHRGSALVVSPDGSVVAAAGDPDQFIFLRSSAKPFQLAPFVASGRFDDYDLGPEALAIMAASHSGEDRHVRTVQEILRRGGLSAAVLQNQVHPPYDVETARRMVRDGEQPSALRGNCSGKHAGMVLFAKASGWPIETYWHPDHPVQRLALETVSALSDVPIEEIATATDGCGVVTFGMPLRGLAIAFARLADPSAVADRTLGEALRRIRDAMMAHPELVAGERRRIDTALMGALPGKIVSKGGAEGVLAMGLPPGALPEDAPFGDGPVGIAATVEDGNAAHRAGDAVSIELLRQVGLFESGLPANLEPYLHPAIVDPRGDPTGEVRPAFRLARA